MWFEVISIAARLFISIYMKTFNEKLKGKSA